jgi:hypothetical protein
VLLASLWNGIRGAIARRRIWDWGLLALLTLAALRGWLSLGKIASTRLENVPELAIVWMMKQRILSGGLLAEWSAYEFGGFALVRFLSYPLYDVLALLSIVGNLSLDGLFKGAFLLGYVASAITLYELAYELTGKRAPSLIAGLIYALFPFHLHGPAEAWVHIVFWALLPLLFLCYERSRRARVSGRLPWRHALLMGVLVGCMPLVNTEHALLTAPFLGLYLLWREAGFLWQNKRQIGAVIGFWALAALVALGLSAFFVLPGVIELEYVGIHLKHGAASFQSDELLRDYAVSPALLWRSILRRFGGDYTLPQTPVIGSAFWSIAWYPGVIACVLALLGLRTVRWDGRARALLALLAAAALFVVGEWWPGNLFVRLPFIGRLAAFRGLVWVAFALALFAAWGAQWIMDWLAKRRPRWQPVSRVALPVLVAAFIFLDYYPAMQALRTVPDYFPADEVEAYRWLDAQSAEESFRQGFRSWEYATTHRGFYLQSYALQYDGGLHFWGYYDNGAPRHIWALCSWGDVPTALRLGSVRYVLTRADTDPELLRRIQQEYPKQVWTSEHLTIWENSQWPPYVRAYSASALYLGDPEYRALDILPGLVEQGVALVSGPSDYADDYAAGEIASFDRVIVREPWYRSADRAAEIEQSASGKLFTHQEILAAMPDWSSQPPAAQIAWTRPDPQQIVVNVKNDAPITLMVSEAWYPNWRVYIDGQAEPVWRVNYAFLGAVVPAGEHQVLFRYEKPVYVWIGYGISLLTVAALIVAWLIGRRAHKSEGAK